MKWFNTFLLVLTNVLLTAQVASSSGLRIDTLVFEYELKYELHHYTIPQLTGEGDPQVLESINKSVIEKLDADTAHFIEDLLRWDTDNTMEAYHRRMELAFEGEDLDATVLRSSTIRDFQIKWMTEDFLSIVISESSEAYRARGYYQESTLNYDLRTGQILPFDQLFNIGKDDLLKLFYAHGYELDYVEMQDIQRKIEERPDYIIEGHINEFCDNDEEDLIYNDLFKCTSFYLTELKNELHLRFIFSCTGPISFTYGIPLSEVRLDYLHPVLLDSIKAKQ